MAEPTVSAGYVKALLDFAVAHGAGERRLLARACIPAEALSDQDNRLPFARYVALMRAAKAETGDPALALEFGAATDFRKFSVVGLISHASANMLEALQQLNRYGRLVVETEGLGDGPRFQIVEKNAERWMEDRRGNPNDFPELTESTWSRFICWTRRDFPQAVFALEAHVTHPEPAHAEAYQRLWQVPVTFSSRWNAIRSNPAWAFVQIQPENRYAFGVLTERGDELLEELEQAKTLRGQVEAMLMPILHTGDVGIDRITAKLGVSRQTLYRHLKDEGVTFEQVLDDLRRRLALDYLAAKKVSVNETAYLVGFSDPASFSRAFKRWTGVSPREARGKG
ncbi:MAG TPA: AraC family transcriptional regulator [Vitreimonas sp.]|uniref:AraC family transcriptional regulator n=1 Tax=Vitreimonas sp. TaxID=3069702 RepID=UPI002D3F8F47|nr:AraC family transcriptional regulator [Vitreimonas sp.]HYD87616.1 AraC family transcriptional regulator [Vitreimonas sp.]